MRTLLALLLLAALPASAATDYTWLEGGFVSVDRGRDDESGLRIAGSMSLMPQLALIGEFADADDYSQLSAGALFHPALNSDMDLILGATLESVDAGKADDSGFGLRGGVRWHRAGSRLQLEPELRMVDVLDETATSARLGALYELAPRLDLAGALQAGDDDRLEVGVRYRFGR